MHGIGGVKDLPIPIWLFYYGAAAVLVLSFAALGILWRRPLLDDDTRRPLFRLPVRPVRILLGIVGFALFALVFAAALVGERSAGTNLSPTFIWVIFWLGLVPVSVLIGNVWAWLNPWRAAADAIAWLWEQAALEWDPPFTYPERLGRWPGAVLLLAFAALELAYSDPSDPRMLALAIALYSWITWVGTAAFGRDVWFANGEAFSIYFGLLSRLSPFSLRDGVAYVHRPLERVARATEAHGTIAFVAVMLGSVAFDGFSRTSAWQNRLFRIDSDLLAFLFNLVGLVAAVAVVACAFVAAIELARRIGETRAPLERAFIGSLIPIALAYAVAHYFSLFVLQGQLAIPLASDPFGFGWDALGTIDYRVNVQPLTTNEIWYVQAGALVTGHVLGLMIAHDRALAVFGSTRVALRTQYAVLALMVVYTVAGLWVLSRG
jgi:hypothetical protein